MQNNTKKNATLQNDKTRIIISLSIAVLFVLIMFIEVFFDQTLHLNLYKFGVYPRTITGLRGIVLAPFIHGSYKHFFSNFGPFLVLLTGLLYFFPKKGFLIFLLISLGSNIFVWFIGRPAYHIGASGIIYGLAAFIFFSGVLSRRKDYIALSLIVVFLYGSIIRGIFPGADKSISWESHLGGFSLGTVLSLFYHPKRIEQALLIKNSINFIFPYNYKNFNSTTKLKIYYFYTKFNSQTPNYFIKNEKNYFKSFIYFHDTVFISTKTIF